MIKDMTIYGRFLRILAIFIFLTLVLWFGYHQINYTAVSRIAEESTRLAADNLTGQISAEFAQMKTITSAIAGSTYIQDFLGERNVTLYYEKAGIASEIIRQAAFPITSADNVLAINDDGVTYRFSGGLSSQSCEALYQSLHGAGAVYTVVEIENTLFYCHSTPVFDLSGQYPVRLGNVAILTGLEKTRRMLGNEDSPVGMDVAVILGGEIIMSNNHSLEGASADILESRNGLVSTAPVSGSPLSIAAAIPRSSLFPGSGWFLVMSIVFICLLFLLIAALYRYLSRDMIRPMASVIGGVASLGGKQNSRLHEMPVIGKPDFQSLVHAINDMLDRNEKSSAELLEERQKVFESEITRQKMRMSLLASQMDAHFMSNTLVNIQSLAEKGENELAARMAGGLAFLLKHQHKGDALVNVFTEFRALDTYIELMNIRYGGSFSYEFEVDEALSNYLMPGFILQPVAENAIEHGLREKELDARLFIRGIITGNTVCIEVSDTGAGVPPGKLSAIRESLNNAEPQDFPEPGLQGVALMNIQRRIRLQFGGGYGVSIESDYGKGTTVMLSFPLIQDNGVM